jgi:hypothetical protein
MNNKIESNKNLDSLEFITEAKLEDAIRTIVNFKTQCIENYNDEADDQEKFNFASQCGNCVVLIELIERKMIDIDDALDLFEDLK